MQHANSHSIRPVCGWVDSEFMSISSICFLSLWTEYFDAKKRHHFMDCRKLCCSTTFHFDELVLFSVSKCSFDSDSLRLLRFQRSIVSAPTFSATYCSRNDGLARRNCATFSLLKCSSLVFPVDKCKTREFGLSRHFR